MWEKSGQLAAWLEKTSADEWDYKPVLREIKATRTTAYEQMDVMPARSAYQRQSRFHLAILLRLCPSDR
jgi:hypothetical protein